uniref:Uncharacterized protein n=1 Tax=Salix viminalis TaxID=40686 RepID=A0A6N2KRE9_SALVM
MPPFEKPDHRKISGKKTPNRQSRRTVTPPSTLDQAYFEYCVRLGCYYILTEGILLVFLPEIWVCGATSMINVLNGGDEELTVQQGDMNVKQ